MANFSSVIVPIGLCCDPNFCRWKSDISTKIAPEIIFAAHEILGTNVIVSEEHIRNKFAANTC